MSREVVDTFLLAYIYIYTFLRAFYLSVRARCAANDNQLLLLMRARARARLAFPISCRTPIDEISMKHRQSKVLASVPFIFPADALASSTLAKMLSQVCCNRKINYYKNYYYKSYEKIYYYTIALIMSVIFNSRNISIL